MLCVAWWGFEETRLSGLEDVEGGTEGADKCVVRKDAVCQQAAVGRKRAGWSSRCLLT